MGMPADNHMEASSRGVQVESMRIVENINDKFARLGQRRFGQRPCPIRRIHVSAHGYDGSKLLQRAEDFGLAYITRVKNLLRTAKRLQRLRAQQTVSVGDQANPRRRSLHGEILMLWIFLAVEN